MPLSFVVDLLAQMYQISCLINDSLEFLMFLMFVFFFFLFFFFCIFVIFVILLFFPLFIHFFFHFSHSISHILHSSQKIDEPCVKAHLIDARGVEKIILIPTYNEARTVIYEDKPRNVDSCYTIEAEQLQSRSGSAMYFGMTSGGKGRFFDDVDQQIRFVSSLFSSSFPLSLFPLFSDSENKSKSKLGMSHTNLRFKKTP